MSKDFSQPHNEGAGFIPVSIINLCCDFLFQLHKVILGQRSWHYLRSIFDEAVGHLLNAPEQGRFVRLSDKQKSTYGNVTVWGMEQNKTEYKWGRSERRTRLCVGETQTLIRERGNLYIPRRACAISAPIPSELPQAPAPGVNLLE